MKRLLAPLALLLAALSTAGCHQPASAAVEVLIGGRLLMAEGVPVIDYGVVVVEQGKIRGLGPQTHVPIPAGSRKIDTSGLTVRAPAGSRLETGEAANLELVSPDGVVQRRMVRGVWQ